MESVGGDGEEDPGEEGGKDDDKWLTDLVIPEVFAFDLAPFRAV